MRRRYRRRRESRAKVRERTQDAPQPPAPNAPVYLKRHSFGRVGGEVDKLASLSPQGAGADKGPTNAPGRGNGGRYATCDHLPRGAFGGEEPGSGVVVRCYQLFPIAPTLPPAVRPAANRHRVGFEGRVRPRPSGVGSVENEVGVFTSRRRR